MFNVNHLREQEGCAAKPARRSALSPQRHGVWRSSRCVAADARDEQGSESAKLFHAVCYRRCALQAIFFGLLFFDFGLRPPPFGPASPFARIKRARGPAKEK